MANEEQIKAWKHQYGVVYKIETEDGRICYIFDPLSDLKIMKAATTALRKSAYDYVVSVLENCWLDGDITIKMDEAACLGLEDQIQEFTEIPDATVERIGDKYVIKIEDYSLEVRKAKRSDIQWSEQRNASKEVFESSIYLLKRIAITPYEEYSKFPTRILIGMYAATEKVKDKTAARVEKL
jgi:hypothetical protein